MPLIEWLKGLFKEKGGYVLPLPEVQEEKDGFVSPPEVKLELVKSSEYKVSYGRCLYYLAARFPQARWKYTKHEYFDTLDEARTFANQQLAELQKQKDRKVVVKSIEDWRTND